MPTDLPPGRKPDHTIASLPPHWLSRTLNWTALFVGLGLCVWAFNFGVTSIPYSNSPSDSGAHAVQR